MSTPQPNPTVVLAEPVPAPCRRWLAERCTVLGPFRDTAELRDALRTADGLVVRTATQVSTQLLDGAERLRVVGRAGVGLDHIDLDACRERGIAVVHTPGANTTAVVEYVLALTFDALRPRVFLDRALDPAGWASIRDELTATRELGEMTVGVFGCGRIGSEIARVFGALAARVLVHDIREISEAERHGAAQVDRDTLLAESDLITVHVDGRAENRRLFDTDAFGRMKADVVFLNTSRGLVVDDLAAARFFSSHPGALALLDVHDPEPIEPNHPLWALPNAHLAPHLASCTKSAKERMGWVVRDVWRVLQNEAPIHQAT